MAQKEADEFDRLVAEYDESRTLRYAEGQIAWERQTCIACPTQWEGELRDGRMFYFRYRHGYASLGVGGTVDQAVDDPETVGMGLGQSLDGFLDDVEYRRVRDQLLSAYLRS